MADLFNNSFALDEKVHDMKKRKSSTPQKENVRGIFNQLNFSMSTEENGQSKVEKLLELQKHGFIRNTIDEKYVKNQDLNDPINFKECQSLNNSSTSINLKQRIEIYEKREAFKKLLEDSRLNDSRRYMMDEPTPVFAAIDMTTQQDEN